MSISSSNTWSTNYTKIQKTDLLEASKIMIKNGNDYTIFNQGKISNMKNPVLSHQAATLAYVLDNAGSSVPGGAQNSIQYIDNGVFNGSANTTYNNTTKILTSNVSNGFIDIKNGTVTGLSLPTNSNHAASKDYLGSSLKLTLSNINITTSTTYLVSQMLNGIISRNITGANTKVFDTIMSAQDIITESGGAVGTTFHFMVKNTSTDLNSIIQLRQANMGDGVTLRTSTQNIYPGYQYTSQVIITSTSPPLVDICTLYNGKTLTTINHNYQSMKKKLNIGVIQCTDFLLEHIQTIENYSPYEGQGGGYFYYNVTPNGKTRKINKLSQITGTGDSSINTNYVRLRPDPGYYDFYLINPINSLYSTFMVLQGEITADPNSVLNVPPGKTGWYLMNNTMVSCIGVFNTNN